MFVEQFSVRYVHREPVKLQTCLEEALNGLCIMVRIR